MTRHTYRVSCPAYYRVLYLPSLGYCLLVSIGCKRLHSILPKVNFVCSTGEILYLVILVVTKATLCLYGIFGVDNVSENNKKK